MRLTNDEFLQPINNMIADMFKTIERMKEQELAHIIEENDFVVGSPIVKAELEEAFKGMRVSYSPYVAETEIIMIKKAMVVPSLVPLERERE